MNRLVVGKWEIANPILGLEFTYGVNAQDSLLLLLVSELSGCDADLLNFDALVLDFKLSAANELLIDDGPIL